MNKVLLHVIIAADFIVITMIGLIRTDYKSDAFATAIIPIALCASILMFSHHQTLFKDRKSFIWDILLAGLFVLMLSAEEALKVMSRMDGEVINRVFKVAFFPVLFVSLLIDIDYILAKAMKLPEKFSEPREFPANKFLGIYRPVWDYIALTFVFVIAYFPGLMNSDFEAQWMWGWSETTQWSDWHTVGYLFFVRLCTAIIHKPFMITIVQVLMFWLTANYAVGVLKKRFPQYPHLGGAFMTVYVCFGFYTCMYMSEIRKDNCSTTMMLAFAISILDHVLSRQHEIKEYINMAIFAFLASIFRHSLWEIVLVTLLCVIISEIVCSNDEKTEKKRVLFRLSVVFVSTVIAFLVLTEGIAFGLLKAERNPAYIKYTVPMNLAASMAYRSQETGLYIDEDIVKKMEQIIPMDKWAEYYCAYDADTTDRPWHEIGDNVYKLDDSKIARDLISVNLYYLTHYPKQFILSFFDVNSMVWEIAKASDLIMYSPGLASEHYEIHHMRKGEFYFFDENLKAFLGSFALGRTIVYRGGLYLYIMAIVTVILFKKRQFRVFTATLPILLYAAALMISIPQEGTHYIMPFPLFAAFFLVVAFAISRRER